MIAEEAIEDFGAPAAAKCGPICCPFRFEGYLSGDYAEPSGALTSGVTLTRPRDCRGRRRVLRLSTHNHRFTRRRDASNLVKSRGQQKLCDDAAHRSAPWRRRG